jgi:hypothetical protein
MTIPFRGFTHVAFCFGCRSFSEGSLKRYSLKCGSSRQKDSNHNNTEALKGLAYYDVPIIAPTIFPAKTKRGKTTQE